MSRLSGEYITLHWGGREFGSFGVEDIFEQRLIQALANMVKFHLDWTAEVNPEALGCWKREDYKATGAASKEPDGTTHALGLAKAPLGDYEPVFEVLVNGGVLTQINHFMPPDLASGKRQITEDDIQAAIKELYG